MATLLATITELDVIDVWGLLDKYNINLSVNEIMQQGTVVLSSSERIVVRNSKLMLEVL
jgi:hypothetical protein